MAVRSSLFIFFMLIVNTFHCAAFAQVIPSGNEKKNVPLKQSPQRIASINLCIDAMLLKFVEPQRIVSITRLSENAQFSSFYQQAKPFPKNTGLAEQVVLQKPDLVLAGEFGAGDAKQMLQFLGYPVETLTLPRTLADISEHIRHFGRLTNTAEQTEIYASKVEQGVQRLMAIARQQSAIPAFWYSSNGIVVGEGTLEDELMQAAGFHNLARDFHLQGFAPLDLELLLQARPQAIIIESSDARAFSLASEYLSHPALINSGMQIVELPKTLSVCIAPIADQVLDSLLQQRQLLFTKK